MKTLPAGIFWEQVRGNEWVVTVRREPETVREFGDLGYSPAFGSCPYCGGAWGGYGGPLGLGRTGLGL